MAKQFEKRLGRTADDLKWAEITLAQKPLGALIILDGVYLVKKLDGIQAYDKVSNLVVSGGGVVDAMTKLTKLEDAVLTIAQQGRAYKVNPSRITLHVWSKDYTRLDSLKEVFGGNYYNHGSGSLWICSKRGVLREIWEAVMDHDTGDRLIELKEWYDEQHR